MTIGYKTPEEVIASFGTSLEETRKMIPELRAALKRKQKYAFMPSPIYLQQAELAEYGIELEEPMPEGWLLKIKPGKDGAEPTTSFITAEKWEMITGGYISPEGIRQAEPPSFEEAPSLYETMEELPTGPAIPPARQFRMMVEQGLIPEGSSFLGIEEGQIKYIPPGEAEALRVTFPGELPYAVLEYAQTDPEGFIGELLEAGRSEETETILKMLGATEADIGEIFGEIPTAPEVPEIPAEGVEVELAPPAYAEEEVPQPSVIATIKPDYSVWVDDKKEGTLDPETGQFVPEGSLWRSIWERVKLFGLGVMQPIKYVGQFNAFLFLLKPEELGGIKEVWDNYWEEIRQEPSVIERAKRAWPDTFKTILGGSLSFALSGLPGGELRKRYDELPWYIQLLCESPAWAAISAPGVSATAARAGLLGRVAAGGRLALPARVGAAALRPMAGVEALQVKILNRMFAPLLQKMARGKLIKAFAKWEWPHQPASKVFPANSKNAKTLYRIFEAYGKYPANNHQVASKLAAKAMSDKTFREGILAWFARSGAEEAAIAPLLLKTGIATEGASESTSLVVQQAMNKIIAQNIPASGITAAFISSFVPEGVALGKTVSLIEQLKDMGYSAEAISAMSATEAWANLFKSVAPEAITPVVKPPTEVPVVKPPEVVEMPKARVEAGAYTEQEIANMTAELEGLKEWFSTEPAAKLLNLIKKIGWYKGEISNLTLKQYKLLTEKIPSQSILTTDGKHVRWEYALDDVATEMGYASGDALKEAIEGAGTSLARIKSLQAELRTAVAVPTIVTPVVKVPVVSQIKQLYSEIDVEVKAAQAAVKGLTGDEAKIARETLKGLERELAYVDRTLKGFTLRPELPDATKLRQTIMAWARYKGIPKTQLTKITSSIAGRRHLSVVPQEQLVKILDKVREFRPVRIGGKTVVTTKTEVKLHSLKDTLREEGLLNESAYQNLKSRLGLLADKYVRHNLFITESDARALIRAMNDEAEVGYAAIQAIDAKVLEAHPDIARRVADIEARINKQGGVYFEGKPASVTIFKDMRFYTEDLEIKTGKPFKHIWDLANNRHLENRVFYTDLLKDLRSATPAYTKIVNDKDALQRISDYIAAKNNWLKVKSPADITPEEIKLANKIEQLLMDRIPDYRYQRFLHFYHQSEGNVDIIIGEIPDAPRKAIQTAINIYESKGPIALKSYLDTQTWGVIKSGFEPHFVVNPRLAMQRMRRVAFPTGRFQARTTIEFDRMDKDIISRTKTYLRQIVSMNLKPYFRQLETIYADAIPQLKNPRQVGKALSSSLNEMMGYIEEGGLMYRFLVRFASQAYTAIFGTYPHLPFRNLFQNLAFHPDRSCLIDPRNRPLSPQEWAYYNTYITQMEAIPRDLMLAYEGGLPGLGRLNRFTRRLNLYGKSDSKANRPWCNWASFNKAQRALAQYLKDGNLNKFINNSGMNDLTLMQQRDILLLLGRDSVSYKAPTIAAVDGGRAAIREIAREITNNVHFLYERSQRAPIEMAGMGRIGGSLLVFPRSFGQRMLLAVQRLRPGSGATGAQKRHAMKIIIGNILAGIAIGEIYQRITGKKRNPYNPLNILGWTPGGLAIGVAVDLGKAIGDMLMALGGDKDALSRLPGEIARLGDALIPYYYAIVNALEALTDKEYIDRWALRKIRELLDESYTVNESFYEKERVWWAAIIHAMFGGEVEGMEIPPNPEIARIKREHDELFELYDTYGNEDSTRYIEDDDERREAREKLLRDNPEFADDRRRLIMYQLGIGDEKVMEAYKKLEWWKKLIIDIPIIGDMFAKPKEALRLDTELIEDYVVRGRLVDKYGATSAEVHLFDYEHPELRVFGESEDTFDWSEFTPSDQDVKRWKLQVKNRELIDLRDAYGDKHSEQYIKDDEERQKAYDKLFEDNPGFRDDWRRIEAYANDAPTDKIVGDFVDYGKIVDEFGGGSSEAMLFRFDHPGMFKWGQDPEVFGWEDESDWNIPVLRINVKWRELDDKWEGYGDRQSDLYIKDDDAREDAREKLLNQNPGYLEDRLRRDAYSKGYSDENIEKYVEYTQLPTKGDWRERFLLDPANKSFYEEWISEEVGQGHQLINPEEVSPARRDEIYREFEEQFEAWEDTAGLTDEQVDKMRDKLLRVPGFGEARRRVEAYDYGFPEEHHDAYVEWYMTPTLKKPESWEYDFWYRDDRWLMEHPAFEQAMVQLYKDTEGEHGWKEPRDFSKVPTEKVEWLYVKYLALPAGDERLSLRCRHKELDDWLVLVKDCVPCYGTYKCGEGEKPKEPSAAEQAAEAQAIKEWMERMWPEWAK